MILSQINVRNFKLLVYLGYITLRLGCCLRENATIIFIKTTWWRLRTLNNELWISLLWNLMRHSWASFPRHLLAKKAKPFHTSVSNSNYPNLFLSLPTLTYYGCCCLHTKHRLQTSGKAFSFKRIRLGKSSGWQHRFSDLTILSPIWVGTYEYMKSTLEKVVVFSVWNRSGFFRFGQKISYLTLFLSTWKNHYFEHFGGPAKVSRP